LLTTVTTAKNCLSPGVNRFSRNSGMVNTLEAKRNGIKSQIRSENESTFIHSDRATQIP